MFDFEQIQNKIVPIGQFVGCDASVILFFRNDVVMAIEQDGDGGAYCLPSVENASGLFGHCMNPPVRIGTLYGKNVYGAELASMPDELPPGLIKSPARNVLETGKIDVWQAVARAREMVFWRNRHRFCGTCGALLQPSATDLGLVCPQCSSMFFPQIAPAVITAIWRNNRNELLLAHNRRFAEGVFGLIAGFVEMGETLEQAVAREIAEETRVRVKNIQYLSSQSWPFPNSLMLGFLAEYDGGEATPDGDEIVELGWFRKENLPLLPGPGSVARSIINQFFELP